MLHILGMGYAYPSSQIDNALIHECNKGLDLAWLNSKLGISSRASVLPLDFIRSSGNVDHKKAVSVALESPSNLSIGAAQMALEQANIRPEQLGLIIAECSTPLETTPFESQRVGKRLNVKIPAFDIYSASGAMALHLDVLRHWHSENIPDYVLCVSSNTPTQRVNYTKGIEAAYFGDAAAAMLVSTRMAGKFEVLSSQFASNPLGPEFLSIEMYGDINLNQKVLERELVEQLIAVYENAHQDVALPKGGFKLVVNHPDPGVCLKVCEKLGVPANNLIDVCFKRGYSLGSSAMCALAENWNKFAAGDKVLVMQCAGNLGHGYVYLEVKS